MAAVAALAIGATFPRRNPLVEVRGWHVDAMAPHSLLVQLTQLGDRWDARWYLHVVDQGYDEVIRSAAFFPLFPLLATCISAFGIVPWVAGTLLSIAALAASVVLLAHVTRTFPGGNDAAPWAVAGLLASPAAVTLAAIYPESLLVALTLAAWLAALDGRFGTCGVLVGLAMVSKPLGVAALPFLLLQPQQEGALGPLAVWWQSRWHGIVAAVVVAAAWPLTLLLLVGDPLRFIDAQAQWSRSAASALGPVSGILAGGHDAADGLRRMLSGALSLSRGRIANLGDPVGIGMQNFVNAVVIVVLVVLAMVTWRRLGAAAGASVAACALLPLWAPGEDVPLLSAPRFLLVAAPAYVALALALPQRWRELWVACSAACAGMVTFGWATWQWVG